MKKSAMAVALSAILAGNVLANEGHAPVGVTTLDHVFVIMMENHGYSQIMNNPNAPFINQYAQPANLATNYFAIAHPSLTNYLEVVGGSNFGVQSDNYPDWHNTACTHQPRSRVRPTPTRRRARPSARSRAPASTRRRQRSIRPTRPQDPGDVLINIDGVQSIPAAQTRPARPSPTSWSRADRAGRATRRALPASGADGVNYQRRLLHQQHRLQRHHAGPEPAADAERHRRPLRGQAQPVRLFPAACRKAAIRNNSLANTVGLRRRRRPLRRPRLRQRAGLLVHRAEPVQRPARPRQRGPVLQLRSRVDDGTQAGLNPALIYPRRRDGAEAGEPRSRARRRGTRATTRSSSLWDENDYSLAPNTNQVDR